MLVYVLALAVGLGSLAIYMAAFFFPEVHRKNDFIWSGLGLFYALVLWICAGRITGGVLLGQIAGVALLGWSVAQTLSLRRQLTPRQQQTEVPSASEVKNTVEEKVSISLPQKLSQLQKRVTGGWGVKDAQTTQPPSTVPTAVASNASTLESDKVQIVDNRTPIPEQPTEVAAEEQLTINTESAILSVPEVIQPTSPEPELVEAASEPAREDAKAEQEASITTEELDLEIEPALTEEEAIALAVETTLAEDAAVASQGEHEGGELMRPHAPDPELVEAAIRDAEEKHQQASPPHPDQPENTSGS